MIKAQDLRISNLVLAEDNYGNKCYAKILLLGNNESEGSLGPTTSIVELIQNTPIFYGDNYINYNNLHPIQLTPEILLKCNCHSLGEGVFELITTRRFIFKPYNNMCYNIFQVGENNTEMQIATLCYLHQLQNFHYILTNNELVVALF